MPQQNTNRLLFAPCNLRFPPTTRLPTVLVLDEQMRGADFAFFVVRRLLLGVGADGGGAVVLGHEGL